MRLFCNFLKNLRLEFYFLENLVDFFYKGLSWPAVFLREKCSLFLQLFNGYTLFQFLFFLRQFLVNHIFLGISKFCVNFQTYWHKVLQAIPIRFSISLLYSLIFKL